MGPYLISADRDVRRDAEGAVAKFFEENEAKWTRSTTGWLN